jgi:hypothetical protein
MGTAKKQVEANISGRKFYTRQVALQELRAVDVSRMLTRHAV